MNKPLNLFVLLAGFVALPLSSLAEWTVIETYEDGEHPEDYFNVNSSIEGSGEGANIVVQDPLEPANQVNLVSADTGEVILTNNFNVAVFPLAKEIPEGSVATFYHRHMKAGFRHDVVWGLTGFPPPNPDFGGYYLFEELTVAIQYSSRFNYDARTDTYYMGVDGANSRIWSPELNTYYHTWMVIDLEANLYDLYIQGGAYAEPTLVAEDLAFKNPGPIFASALTNPLTHVFVFSIEGTVDNPRGVDPLYLDDLYIDYSGVNLTIPEADATAEWQGFPVLESGWVDTGNWFGWAFVSQAPWVWSSSLDKFVFVEDDSGWIYVPR
jgi:hypothetical protein